MGQHESTSTGCDRARVRRLRPRRCLRKGCDHIYRPRRWNQRYCQEPACRRELRRWQAAKRQRRHRNCEPTRAKHAAAERQRRRQAKLKSKSIEECSGTAARGHAAKDFSRVPCCDRPGCYAARRCSIRNPARYCSDACRSALARVRDRERKWLGRATVAGQHKRRLEYQNDQRRRAKAAASAAGTRGTAAMPRAADPPCGSDPHRSHIIDRDRAAR